VVLVGCSGADSCSTGRPHGGAGCRAPAAQGRRSRIIRRACRTSMLHCRIISQQDGYKGGTSDASAHRDYPPAWVALRRVARIKGASRLQSRGTPRLGSRPTLAARRERSRRGRRLTGTGRRSACELGGDPAPVFEAGKGVLDAAALLVGPAAVAGGTKAASSDRGAEAYALRLQPVAEPVRVVASVAQDALSGWQRGEEHEGPPGVARLRWRQEEGQRLTPPTTGHVQLRVRPTLGADARRSRPIARKSGPEPAPFRLDAQS
jgi:hypothetical protein